ncbi:MAG: dipeptidase [Calditrichaceae bacterium]
MNINIISQHNLYYPVIFFFIIILIIPFQLPGQVDYKKMHQDAMVADLHNDALHALVNGLDIVKENPYDQFDLVSMSKGGVDVQFFAVWPDPRKAGTKSLYDQAVTMIDSFDAIMIRNGNIIMPATTPQEITDIVKSGKTAACLGLEGGAALNNDLKNINYFYNRGVRYITLTWNNSLVWASSARDESNPNFRGRKGLGAFGRLVVQRMNELGMIIDLSHTGEQTFYDTIKYSAKPVIASHSSVYNLCPHYRNLKDEQIKALAKNGGVVFINFYPGFLVKGFDRVYRNARKQADLIEDSLKTIRDHPEFNRAQFIHQRIDSLYPGVSAVVDHIEYVINLVGEDYVGLGSDYCGMSIPPAGLENVSKLPNITRELVRRGYSESTIKKILGGNFMRVFREVSK